MNCPHVESKEQSKWKQRTKRSSLLCPAVSLLMQVFGRLKTFLKLEIHYQPLRREDKKESLTALRAFGDYKRFVCVVVGVQICIRCYFKYSEKCSSSERSYCTYPGPFVSCFSYFPSQIFRDEQAANAISPARLHAHYDKCRTFN